MILCVHSRCVLLCKELFLSRCRHEVVLFDGKSVMSVIGMTAHQEGCKAGCICNFCKSRNVVAFSLEMQQ